MLSLRSFATKPARTWRGKAPRCLLLAMTMMVFAAPLPVQAQDYTSNLVARWKMDETSGDILSDVIGGNDATLYNNDPGDISVNTREGKYGSGIWFDGVDDYADAGDVLNMGTDDWTVSAWIKPEGCDASEMAIVDKRNNLPGEDGYGLRLDCGTSAIYVEALFGAAAASTYQPTGTTDLTPRLGEWIHVAATWDRDGDITLYLDGQEEGSLDISAEDGFDVQNTLSMQLGNVPAGAASYYDGVIDDIRVYNRALPQSDVEALYQLDPMTVCESSADAGKIIFNQDYAVMQYCNGSAWIDMGKEASVLFGQKSTPTKELIGWWKLNETSGSTISDATGNNNGTWSDSGNNDVAEEIMSGPVGTGLTFADDTGRIDTGLNINQDGTQSYTFMGWAYPTALCSVNYCHAISTDAGGYDWSIQIRNNNWHVYDGNSSDSIIAAEYNQWQHVAVSFDHTSNQYKFYFNGAEEGSGAITYAGSESLSIGNGSGGGTPFVGAIDDVRIFNYALSQPEVEKIASTAQSCPATENGLVGYWTMDETGSDTIADSSGQGNNGTWTDNVDNVITAESMTGQVGTALDFDQTENGSITVPHAAELDISSGYTVSGWVYFDSTTPAGIHPSWVSKNDTGGWGSGWLVGRTSGGGNVVDGKVRITATHGRSYNADNFHVTSWIYPVDTWNYITVSWNGNDAKFYLNGALLETGTVTVAPDTSAGDLEIGFSRDNWSGAYADGALDDLRLYNRALTDTEIAALYGASGGTCNASLCENPIGYSGELIFNSDDNVMQYCDGSDWIGLGPASAGGAGCSDPSGDAGSLIYNSDFNILQYCDGGDWRGIGADPTATVLADGLMGHWTLDETTGSSIVDSAGTSDGTWSDNSGNSVAEETAAGPINKGLTFDGVDDYIDLSTTAVGTGSYDDITIAGWYKSAGTSASDDQYMVILGDPVGGARDVFMLGIDEGKTVRVLIESTAGNGDDYYGTSDVIDRSWHHIAATRTKAVGGDIHIYVDGVLEASHEVDDAHEDRTLNILGHSFIGDDPGATEQVNGKLDDIRIYNRALSGGEIAALYELGDPDNAAISNDLIGHWELDETSGPTAADSTVNANDGTMTGTTSVSGPFTNAFEFDGTGDYVSVAHDADLNITGDITVSAWIYPHTFGSGYDENRIMFKGAGTHGDNLFTLDMDDSNITFNLHENSGPANTAAGCDATDEECARGATTLSANTWYHVVGTYDGATARIYVNGTLDGSNDFVSTGTGNTDPLMIGGRDNNTDMFDGAIDDVRLYDRALSDSEISAMYQAAGPCYRSPSPGTVCNDGSIYAGTTEDGDVPMFVTSVAYESTETWNDGETNYYRLDTCYSEWRGECYTAAMMANDSNTVEPGIQPHDAAVYCDGLSAHGHDDWYLPARAELLLLWNGGDPIADVVTDGSEYHSSYERNTSEIWQVRFSDGGTPGDATKDEAALVRCARK